MSEEKEKISITIPVTSGFTHILFQLAALDYTHITVGYAGSGDEGSIESVCLYKKDCVYEETDGSMILNKDSDDYSEPSENLKSRIEDYCYENLLKTLSDWCDNDGGQGTIYISIADGHYHCDHNTNYMETNSESHQGQFSD